MDGLYFFNRNPDFAPYAVAGLAYAREGYSDTNKNNNLLAKVGLGFTKRLTDSIDFRTDARYQVHGNRAGTGNLGDWVISAGLNIALCAKAQTPAPYLRCRAGLCHSFCLRCAGSARGGEAGASRDAGRARASALPGACPRSQARALL